MSQRTDIEMQYQPAQDQMVTDGAAQSNTNAPGQNATEEKPKRTFLGMRGGGIILDLCACFICCECMDGCCHAIDDCCCC